MLNTAQTGRRRWEHPGDLAPVLHQRRWQLRPEPYPHAVAAQVFTPPFYAELVRDFRAVVDQGQAARYNTKHDFFGASLRRGECGTLEVFLSRAWHETLRAMFNVPGEGFVTAGVHRHAPGSRDGFVHNDIHPESLDAALRSGEAIHHGEPGTAPRGKTVRAVAVLFYLNNGAWSPGDGGETGMYYDWKDPLDDPVEAAPPRDNTLLAFACNPHSYHSFRANKRRRDSVISFIYQDLDDYLQQWGHEGVQQYAEYGAHHA